MWISPHAQRTLGWFADRCGIITASAGARMLTPKTLKPSTQVDTYLDELIAEWLLGQPSSEFRGTFWTDRGGALEPEARRVFALETGLEARECGLVKRSEHDLVGASLDSLAYNGQPEGTHELKCPALPTHMSYWRAVREAPHEVPGGYRIQCQIHLWVTELPRGWFQSYHPPTEDGPVPDVLVEFEPEPDVQSALDDIIPATVERLRAYRESLLDIGCVPVDPCDAMAEREAATGWQGAA